MGNGTVLSAVPHIGRGVGSKVGLQEKAGWLKVQRVHATMTEYRKEMEGNQT